MANFKLTGLLIYKGETEKKTETFSVREFVVEEPDDRYPQSIKLQLSNDKCALIDSIAIGSEVEVEANVQGRKWEKDGKVNYFNTLSAWKVKALNVAPQNEPVRPSQTVNPNDANDLPF